MAKITIKNDGVTFDVPDGARLLEYAKANSAMLFGCENGECATCICTVLKGKENLNERNHAEDLLLKKRGAYAEQRLGCQIWVKKGSATIEY